MRLESKAEILLEAILYNVLTNAPGNLEWQLNYAKYGVSTFPVDRYTKRPLVETGKDYLESATTDPRKIRAWHKRWSEEFAIGMPTGRASGVIVVDLRRRPCTNGVRAYRTLIKHMGGAGTNMLVTTPAGGWHYYYAHPGQGRVRSLANLGGTAGVDVMADGAFVILPPSRSPLRGEEHWLWRLGKVKPWVGTAPEWLIDMVTRPFTRIVSGDRDDRPACVEGEPALSV